MSRDDSGIIKGFVSILFGKLGIIAISVFFTPIIVRILGAKLYGNYAYAISLVSVLTLVANFGFNDGVRKFIAEIPEKRGRAFQIHKYYLKSGLITSTILASCLFLLTELNAELLISEKYTKYVPILCLIIVSNQLFQISRYGLMGLGKEGYSESLNVLFKLGSAGIGIGLAAYGFGVSGVLAGHLLSVLPLGFVSLYVIRNSTLQDKPNLHIKRQKLLTYGIWSFALGLLTTSLYHVDVLILGNYGPSDELGYYKAALTVAELLWFIPHSVQTVLVHSTSAIWKEGDFDRITNLTSKATRFTLIITLLCSIGLFILSEEFVTVYFGVDFTPTVVPLKILLPGVLFFSLSRPIFAVGQGKGDMKILVLATLSAAVLNLVLNLLLIPRLGIVGAGVATSISYGSMILFHTLAALKMGYNPLSDIRALRTIGAGAITYFVLDNLNNLISNNILSIMIVAVVGGVIYATLVLLFGSVSRSEVQEVFSEII
ncbi:hypothetical protein BVU17_08080 [Haloarcula taiwanensis]|uniref:Uncharacterized protein n=1 Tax=Haloarcula taiwanensis TaxID=1932004 RepID=A0A2H4ZYC5_9EURY|nr:flippase [Haloarcula taiwanensis]AUG47475.1 hypothetical protein BVU17_08080 [Haloarcula taiwanensis]